MKKGSGKKILFGVLSALVILAILAVAIRGCNDRHDEPPAHEHSDADGDYHCDGCGEILPHEHPISRVQQAVFLGFEVLTVTYNNQGKLTVIPVVQSPIHIFDDVDVYLQEKPPLEWWQIALAVILVVLLLVLLAPILPYIIRALIWVIALPFKLISAGVRGVKNSIDGHKKE